MTAAQTKKRRNLFQNAPLSLYVLAFIATPLLHLPRLYPYIHVSLFPLPRQPFSQCFPHFPCSIDKLQCHNFQTMLIYHQYGLHNFSMPHIFFTAQRKPFEKLQFYYLCHGYTGNSGCTGYIFLMANTHCRYQVDYTMPQPCLQQPIYRMALPAGLPPVLPLHPLSPLPLGAFRFPCPLGSAIPAKQAASPATPTNFFFLHIRHFSPRRIAKIRTRHPPCPFCQGWRLFQPVRLLPLE